MIPSLTRSDQGMTTSKALVGQTVLILEDDYLLADDLRQALEAVGAQVLGPCGNAGEAAALADMHRLDCAVVDINLGAGASFAPARDFVTRGVPIIFTTGYDASIIPDELRVHPCLQKPVRAASLIEAVSRVCLR